MHEITVNLDTLIWIATGIGAVCAAIVWLKKGTAPFIDPLRQMKNDVKDLKNRKSICDQKFAHDQKQLTELTEYVKMLLRTQMLILKHVETGNCTGEVAAGRKELEEFLIDRD